MSETTNELNRICSVSLLYTLPSLGIHYPVLEEGEGVDCKCVTGHDKFVARSPVVDGLIGGAALASPSQLVPLFC